MASEELKQTVFSSVLMSTKLKSSQASVTYPCCSFCGGNTSTKSSPKRKVLLCQLSLYVNPSESFLVWGKKQDEPKGMLWLRSCCVRKGQEGAIELISRGCRGRCSYTVRLTSPTVTDDWYRSLRGESRRAPSLGDDVPEEVDGRMSVCLDAILTEMAPSPANFEEEDAELDRIIELQSPSTSYTPAPAPVGKKSAFKLKKSKKLKSTPVLCKPLQGLVSIKTNCPGGVMGSYSASILPLEGVEDTTALPVPDIEATRWSWPRAFTA